MRGATRYKQRRNSTGEQDAPAFFVPAFAFECALVQARDAVQVALELDVFLSGQNNFLVSIWNPSVCRAKDGRLGER